MRKNRKTTKKMSVVAANSVRFGVIILFLFAMVIINLLASSSCTQLLKTIGDKKRELKTLEDTCQREQSRWEGMRTPDKIEAALLANGMRMILPKYDQIVRVKAGGRVSAGQLAVQRARQRGGESSAKNRYPRVKR